MRRDRAVVALALAFLLSFGILGVPPVVAEEGSCPADPLAGVPGAAGRWQLVVPCVTVTGTVVVADFPSSNGAYWITIDLDPEHEGRVPGGSAPVWAKFYPSLYQTHRPVEGERVRLTGAVVDDLVWGWTEIVPVRAVEVLAPAPPQKVVVTFSGIGIGADEVLYALIVSNPTGETLRNLTAAVDGQTWRIGQLPPGGSAGPYNLWSGRSRPPITAEVSWDGGRASAPGSIIEMPTPGR